jgi:hypothetical protein
MRKVATSTILQERGNRQQEHTFVLFTGEEGGKAVAQAKAEQK